MATNKFTPRGPYYHIKPNAGESHQVSPSWLVVIVPFVDSTVGPSKGQHGKLETRPIIKILNDAIAVNVTRSKSSFIKGASIVLKNGEIDYIKNVRPQDYVFIWASNWQEEMDNLFQKVGNGPCNDFKSGLKFAGRVSDVLPAVSVSPNGIPDYTTVLNCKMFTELGQSVYVSRYVDLATGDQNMGPTKDHNFLQLLSPEAYNDFITGSGEGPAATPDKIIRFIASVFLGVGPSEKAKNVLGLLQNSEQKGTRNSAILSPPIVSSILGNNGVQNYINNIHFYTGIETYSSGDANQNIAILKPSSSKASGTFKVSSPLKGHVFLRAAPWENVPLDSILREWLNPVANEMFTCMRFDPIGGIRPTVVARQIPFSTQNFKRYAQKGISFYSKSGIDDKKLDELTQTTKFNNLPRWIIDPAMIKSVNVGSSATDHTNFVQVFGTSFINGLAVGQNDAQTLQSNARADSLAQGNFVSDEQDIAKNGLHAKIMETPFDLVQGLAGGVSTLTPILSGMQADFNFNNHLKWTGRVSCAGITEPICEGDNAEIDGILYHIESVDHMCRVGKDGRKEFATILSLSNGTIAGSLDSNGVVQYPDNSASIYINNEFSKLFGTTDVQTTIQKNRNPDGSKKDK